MIVRRPPLLVEPPQEPPVDLAAAKKHLRVDHDDDDDMIQEAIDAATQKLDGYSGALGRSLVTQGWAMDGVYYAGTVRLCLAPVQSATVTYFDDAGTAVTYPESDYMLGCDSLGWFLQPRAGHRWPQSFNVKYIAGYGGPDDVPSDIRLAIKLDVEMAYDRPEGDRFDALKEQYETIVRRNRRGML